MSEVLERAFDTAGKSNWQIKTLGDVCRTSSGGTPSRSRPDFFNGNIPWVKSGELTDGLVSEVSEFISEEALAGSSAKLLPVGTLLIAMYGATVGKLGVLARAAATNQAVCAIFPPPDLDAKFLFWYLRRQRSNLIAKAVGGAQPNISQTILRDLELPIPPLDEQREIVAELEKQFSRLDEAVANLQRVKANLKRYKASVLKAAVEGRLVETEATLARREGRTYETGEQLLQRILDERRAKWSGKGKYKEPIGVPADYSLQLPDGWTGATVDQLGNVQLGKMLDKQKHTAGMPYRYLRNINVRWGDFDLSDVFEMNFEADELERFSVRTGDVLVCEGGEPARAAVWRSKQTDMKYQKALHRVRFDGAFLPDLLVFALEHMAKSGALDELYGGSTIKHFTRETFVKLVLPVPPIGEQIRIVAEVDRHLSIIREVEAEVDANLQRAQALRQASLAAAFVPVKTKGTTP